MLTIQVFQATQVTFTSLTSEQPKLPCFVVSVSKNKRGNYPSVIEINTHLVRFIFLSMSDEQETSRGRSVATRTWFIREWEPKYRPDRENRPALVEHFVARPAEPSSRFWLFPTNCDIECYIRLGGTFERPSPFSTRHVSTGKVEFQSRQLSK